MGEKREDLQTYRVEKNVTGVWESPSGATYTMNRLCGRTQNAFLRDAMILTSMAPPIATGFQHLSLACPIILFDRFRMRLIAVRSEEVK